MTSTSTPPIASGTWPSGVVARRLTRSEFLGRVAAVVLGAVAATIGVPTPAAAHGTTSPVCCGPSKRCSSCNAYGDCLGGCTVRSGECPGGGSFWNCCYGSGSLYECNDWWDTDGHKCICARYLAPC